MEGEDAAKFTFGRGIVYLNIIMKHSYDSAPYILIDQRWKNVCEKQVAFHVQLLYIFSTQQQRGWNGLHKYYYEWVMSCHVYDEHIIKIPNLIDDFQLCSSRETKMMIKKYAYCLYAYICIHIMLSTILSNNYIKHLIYYTTIYTNYLLIWWWYNVC